MGRFSFSFASASLAPMIGMTPGNTEFIPQPDRPVRPSLPFIIESGFIR